MDLLTDRLTDTTVSWAKHYESIQVRGQTEMSHAFHADNCQLKKTECDPSPPAYFYRDYSALLYLNKEFTGGNLVFAEMDNQTGRLEITIITLQ